nr:nucleoporin GLE1-like [Aegilops tauschii subsp. strangulata]
MPIQFQTQHSTNDLEEQLALGYVQVEENPVNNSEEQMEIEKVMEETRRKEIEMFRKKKNKEKDTSLKRKATAMDNEEDSDDDHLEEYGDILARLEEMKRQREDPILHFEGDTNVEEMYEIEEEEDALYEPESKEEDAEEEEEEEVEEEEQEEQVGQDGHKKKRKKKHIQCPTSRSHASVEELFEEDWIPSSDEDRKPMDLGVEDDDGAEALAYVLSNGRKSRAKKMKKRIRYDEERAHPNEQFVKHLCFIDVYQFRNALQTMHIAQNKNYEYHRNCSDRVIAQCIDETCPFYVAASQIANEKTFTIRKQYLVHTFPSVSENTKVIAKWVAKFCEEAIRNDPCTTITTIINTAKSKYGVEISTHMAYTAKKAAKNVVLGDQKAEYTRIRDYLQAVLDTNPGLDECFIKLTTGQQILAATGRDGNNNIFPIAFGIVDKEDTDSWTWFLYQLRVALCGQSGKV